MWFCCTSSFRMDSFKAASQALYFGHSGQHAMLCSVVSESLWPWTVGCQVLSPWDFPGKNTGVGCRFLLQYIFLTWGSNPHLLCLLSWQVDSLHWATTQPLWGRQDPAREGTGALSVSTESSPEDVRKFLERVFQTVGCMPHVLKAGKEWNRRYWNGMEEKILV